MSLPWSITAVLLGALQVPGGHGQHGHEAESPPRPDAGREVASPALLGAPGAGSGTSPAVPRSIRVGPKEAWRDLAAALEASAPGDTVRIAAGVHEGHFRVEHALVLLGEPGAVLDGGGSGTVLRVRNAPGAVVRGLTLRGSGSDVSREDAGLMAERSPGLVVEGSRVLDVLFGIYLKESRDAVVRDNVVVGKEGLEVANRGDGIRFWYSSGGRIEDNRVLRSRDVVIWFSDSLDVKGNRIEDGRYGLHYMYSDHNRFRGNRFSGNLVGAFIMYSSDLAFEDNVFAASSGASGMGLGLKDADDIQAIRNVFVDNDVGIYLDNSPRSVGSRNRFRDNLLALNGVGISLLPSVKDNAFEENDFVENGREVVVLGGGSALANEWRRNHWSRYAGFDQDGDGLGDTPFVLSRLSDRLLTGNPELDLFRLSPAAEALDVLARVLPFLAPQPVVVDSLPRIETGRALAAPPVPPGPARATLALGLLVLALGAGVGARRLRRLVPRRSRPAPDEGGVPGGDGAAGRPERLRGDAP